VRERRERGGRATGVGNYRKWKLIKAKAIKKRESE
jgi:hypothetical protein